MSPSYWLQVHRTGLAVPEDRPLGDLTAELTTMLGDPDPRLRRGIAYATLATWIDRGVYDDLLCGLGDGMAAGLVVGVGDDDGDTVFRRGVSALLLGECIRRDNTRPLVTGSVVLAWGDAMVSWLLRERDLRGWVPTKGWARAVGHGADALAILAQSPHVATLELTVLLDVVADRLDAPDEVALVGADVDALAATATAVLRRNAVPLNVLEPWVARIGAAAVQDPSYDALGADAASDNAQAFLRALYLQLAWSPQPPELRSDVLLVLVDALRDTNPGLTRRPSVPAPR